MRIAPLFISVVLMAFGVELGLAQQLTPNQETCKTATSPIASCTAKCAAADQILFSGGCAVKPLSHPTTTPSLSAAWISEVTPPQYICEYWNEPSHEIAVTAYVFCRK